MKDLSSAICKSRQFQTIIMTNITSSKKHIIQITNHLKQLASTNGLVSLSSSQIGQPYSMFVMLQNPFVRSQKFTSYKCKPNHYSTFINPKILDYSIEEVMGWQECASYPNVKFMIKRSAYVIGEYEKTFKDRAAVKEEFKGFEALIFQHEMTHTRCDNLFDIAESVQLVGNAVFSDNVKQKLKEEFDKFKIQRDQSRIVNRNMSKSKIRMEVSEESQTGTQINLNGTKLQATSFNYSQAKSLRDFIQFEIIDPA